MKTNYVLIDLENVQPEHLELLDQEWIKVLVFVGKNQTKLPIEMVKGIQRLGVRAQYVEMSGTGHNALDFHIAFYIGRLSAVDNDTFFHIVSNDSGFDPLIAHLKQEHILSDRVGKIEDIPAIVQNRSTQKTLPEKVAYAKERLLKKNTSRPRTRKTLTSHLSALFLKTLAPEELDAIVAELLREGFVCENGKRVEYADE